MKVSACFEEYLSRNVLEPSTILVKQRVMRWFIGQFGDIGIDEFAYRHAEQFRKTLVDRGLKASAVNVYLMSLAALFTWALRDGQIRVNPFFGLKPLSVGTEMCLKPYTADELDRLIRFSDDDWRAYILLAACCSLRSAEIHNLLISDIHFDKAEIWVTAKRDFESGWEWKIKNNHQRVEGLPEVVQFPSMQINFVMLLAKLIESRSRQPYVCLPEKYYIRNMQRKGRGALMWEHRDRPWGGFSRDYRNLQKRIGVEPKRFHDLRGTFCTTLLKKGCSLKEVQGLMGHSTINTTGRYYIWVEEHRTAQKSARLAHNCYATNSP